MKENRLAIDIGASSGRIIVGSYENHQITSLKEIYRFPNGVQKQDGHLVWDVLTLFSEVKIGLKKALEEYHDLASMSVDTWGVDYVLLDENDKEILPVYAYRDTRTEKVINHVHAKISFSRLYEITGSQFQVFNSIYQFEDDLEKGRLAKAKSFLNIPEYLLFKLGGKKVHEYTNASTTGMLDSDKKEYSKEIIQALGFPSSLFTPLSYPGEYLGEMSKEVQEEIGGNIPLYLGACHDTGAAVEGIPDLDFHSLYLSSGTWSLLGVKSKVAIKSDLAKEKNYSNETGPDYIRFQKNIMGMWLIQGLAKQMNLDFPTMVKMAKSSSYQTLFDINDARLLSSLDMKESIKMLLKEKGADLPIEDADYINSVYHALAYSYKQAIDEVESITGQTYQTLKIVGGGAKNEYLNELTANYSHKQVIALPIEATSIGNLLSQKK